jgi:glycosyltransferase involved in cell wall biosynthesis
MPSKVAYSHKFLDFKIGCSLLYKLMYGRIKGRNDIIMIGGWDGIYRLSLIFFCGIFNIKYIFGSDSPNIDNYFGSVINWIKKNILLKFITNTCTKIITTGKLGLNAYNSLGISQDKLINFPYWIDLNLFTNEKKKDTSPKKIVFLSVGRLINNLKGFDLSLWALSYVINNFDRKFEFEFRIVGDGPDLEDLIKLSDELGLGEQVKFLGWKNSNQLLEEFRSANIFLHSSPSHEPYGVVILEAMASGLVVIASDKTGAAIDRITSGFNGFLYEAGNIKELARLISSLPLKNLKVIEENAKKTSQEWPLSKARLLVEEFINF